VSEFKPGDVVAVKGRIVDETFVGVGGDDGEEEVVYRRWADIAPWVSPERIAALEALWAWTEDMLDCADCEDGYCNRHHEEFVGVCHRLAALADPPGSRDREEP
jgi:hypothetical protein